MTIEYICIVLFSHKFKLENCIRINNSSKELVKMIALSSTEIILTRMRTAINGSPPLSLPCGDSLR